MQDQLNFVLLYVRDIAAERDFYTQKVGLELEANSPTFVQFRAQGAAAFALLPGEHPTPTATIELWWQTDDVDGTHARLASQGVEMVSAPHDLPFGHVFSIKDPEGNLMNFWHPRQA